MIAGLPADTASYMEAEIQAQTGQSPVSCRSSRHRANPYNGIIIWVVFFFELVCGFRFFNASELVQEIKAKPIITRLICCANCGVQKDIYEGLQGLNCVAKARYANCFGPFAAGYQNCSAAPKVVEGRVIVLTGPQLKAIRKPALALEAAMLSNQKTKEIPKEGTTLALPVTQTQPHPTLKRLEVQIIMSEIAKAVETASANRFKRNMAVASRLKRKPSVNTNLNEETLTNSHGLDYSTLVIIIPDKGFKPLDQYNIRVPETELPKLAGLVVNGVVHISPSNPLDSLQRIDHFAEQLTQVIIQIIEATGTKDRGKGKATPCHFPKTWKLAEVAMMPKTGKRDMISARLWRPIALLSCIGKNLERIVAKRIGWTALKHGIISPQHSRALSKRFVMDLMASFIHDVEMALLAGKEVTMVTMDICPERYRVGIEQSHCLHPRETGNDLYLYKKWQYNICYQSERRTHDSPDSGYGSKHLFSAEMAGSVGSGKVYTRPSQGCAKPPGIIDMQGNDNMCTTLAPIWNRGLVQRKVQDCAKTQTRKNTVQCPPRLVYDTNRESPCNSDTRSYTGLENHVNSSPLLRSRTPLSYGSPRGSQTEVCPTSPKRRRKSPTHKKDRTLYDHQRSRDGHKTKSEDQNPKIWSPCPPNPEVYTEAITILAGFGSINTQSHIFNAKAIGVWTGLEHILKDTRIMEKYDIHIKWSPEYENIEGNEMANHLADLDTKKARWDTGPASQPIYNRIRSIIQNLREDTCQQ
ncbi:hypothetical protein SBOR_9801 [Sclerotinia borealis F-4128]|uniref:RNase H type-1 domain-containing protein n=1 Tax=Sclerotinia borealis (strain F-4128) TaxID=1432307 RepID=W9C5K4_SCLBF|nr:hypothetical protein SBOR_9801 [Sclerotinia borealis F-4128]